MVAVIDKPIDAPSSTDGGEVSHYVCCFNEDVAFCGEDVSGEDWDDASSTCPKCLQVYLEHNFTCPFGKDCPDE